MSRYCFIRKNTAELCSALEELGLVCYNPPPSLPGDTGISLAHDSDLGDINPNCYLNIDINNPILEEYLLKCGDIDCGTDEELFLSIVKNLVKEQHK